ncbi:unnamed protein product [Fraxinus pennsylvanica]|uniref:Molybdopterin oxidoreductase domain-containing protein n=1 Tax=Fraxinus pennsylvanica TaxID=56036 RepID=A0AAD2ECJ4_9LAMI|nr:unnamed protein product [Fraxinus pennsylvanica]
MYQNLTITLNLLKVYLMDADDLDLEKVPNNAFVIYQGHHGNWSVYCANVIFPSLAFFEKDGIVNTEGCVRIIVLAVSIVDDVRGDWKIIRELSEVAGASCLKDCGIQSFVY